MIKRLHHTLHRYIRLIGNARQHCVITGDGIGGDQKCVMRIMRGKGARQTQGRHAFTDADSMQPDAAGTMRAGWGDALRGAAIALATWPSWRAHSAAVARLQQRSLLW